MANIVMRGRLTPSLGKAYAETIVSRDRAIGGVKLTAGLVAMIRPAVFSYVVEDALVDGLGASARV